MLPATMRSESSVPPGKTVVDIWNTPLMPTYQTVRGSTTAVATIGEPLSKPRLVMKSRTLPPIFLI